MDVTSGDTVFIGGWEREVCQVLRQTTALDVTGGQGEALAEEETSEGNRAGQSYLGEKQLVKHL